jgi:hypothetical protein
MLCSVAIIPNGFAGSVGQRSTGNGQRAALGDNGDATVTGLLIPRSEGHYADCGRWILYHGKSSRLQYSQMHRRRYSIYNKVPGDGREFCATVDDAVTLLFEPRTDVTVREQL